MSEDYSEVIAAIEGQSRLIMTMLAPLSAEQWQAPTRLAGWDVFTLAAHTMRALKGLVDYTAQPVLDEVPTRDRVSYWRIDGAAMAESVSQRARETAATLSPATIHQSFAQMLEAALQRLNQLPPTLVLKSVNGPIWLGEFAATRLIELSVHGLDLSDALGQSPRLDPAAQAIVVEILEALSAFPRPAALADDDIIFIEAATGRKPYPGLQLSAFS